MGLKFDHFGPSLTIFAKMVKLEPGSLCHFAAKMGLIRDSSGSYHDIPPALRENSYSAQHQDHPTLQNYGHTPQYPRFVEPTKPAVSPLHLR